MRRALPACESSIEEMSWWNGVSRRRRGRRDGSDPMSIIESSNCLLNSHHRHTRTSSILFNAMPRRRDGWWCELNILSWSSLWYLFLKASLCEDWGETNLNTILFVMAKVTAGNLFLVLIVEPDIGHPEQRIGRWTAAAAVASSAKEVSDVSNLCHIFQLTKADNLCWGKIECHTRTRSRTITWYFVVGEITCAPSESQEKYTMGSGCEWNGKYPSSSAAPPLRLAADKTKGGLRSKHSLPWRV